MTQPPPSGARSGATSGARPGGTSGVTPGALPGVSSVDELKAVAQRLAPVLAALADPNRLAILLAVTQAPRSVKALTDALDLPQTLVSHHLKALRDAGVVTVVAQGRSNIYSMCCGALAEPARLLVELSAYGPGDGSARDAS